MRTTPTIANDILRKWRALARARKSSLTPRRYRQRVFELGEPLVPLDHALRIAATLEDEETTRKLEPEGAGS